MKTLIFGSGSDIAQALIPMLDGEVVQITHDDCDVRNGFKMEHLLIQHIPEVIVNCAGVYRGGSIDFANKQEIDVNFWGSYNISYCASKYCPAAIIVHIASDAGLCGKPDKVVYAASKAAVISLVRSQAAAGCPVYAVAPTLTNTKMTAKYIIDPDKVLQPHDVAVEIKNCVDGKYEFGAIVTWGDGNASIIR